MPGLLPCVHPSSLVEQIEPTIGLLKNLDSRHPELLRAEGINPPDYHGKLVFRSAVESIRGEYAAGVTSSRQGRVAALLRGLKEAGLIHEFAGQSGAMRCDFEVVITDNTLRTAGIEVKGGEGNSIKISDRPLLAQEFLIWCHLDGAVRNQPAEGAESIIFGRIVSEITQRGKRIDALVVKDSLCGSATRPCPKYAGRIPHPMLGVAPCIFLFPCRPPHMINDPEPPVHSQRTLMLPYLILQAHGVSQAEYGKHISDVRLKVWQQPGPKGPIGKREVTVKQGGTVLAHHVTTLRKPKAL